MSRRVGSGMAAAAGAFAAGHVAAGVAAVVFEHGDFPAIVGQRGRLDDMVFPYRERHCARAGQRKGLGYSHARPADAYRVPEAASFTGRAVGDRVKLHVRLRQNRPAQHAVVEARKLVTREEIGFLADAQRRPGIPAIGHGHETGIERVRQRGQDEDRECQSRPSRRFVRTHNGGRLRAPRFQLRAPTGVARACLSFDHPPAGRVRRLSSSCSFAPESAHDSSCPPYSFRGKILAPGEEVAHISCRTARITKA